MDIATRGHAVGARATLRPATGEAELARWTPWILAALVLLVFGDVFFFSGHRVAGAPDTDAALYFAGARAFGFQELRHGHLALWNPYQFAGTPFLGNFQSALLYPPNWPYLWLPLPLAMNLEVALHLWLLGWGMTLWAARRGLHPAGRLLAACLAMFGGPVFLRTYAGHLSLIDAAAWMPFVFLAVESLWGGHTRRGVLLGTGAVALQLLAGHPQVVFITAVAAGSYALLGLADDRRRWRQALRLGGCYAAAAALAAAQLGAGGAAAAESTRQGGLSLAAAASYALAPANLITLLVPGFFGDTRHFPYWGAWNAWEEAIFLGVFGLALALYGACCASQPFRRRLTLLALGMFGLALAPCTPLFPLLCHAVPGFDRFRADCRFAIPGLLFLALLAGMGVDALTRGPRHLTRAAAAALAAALALALIRADLCAPGPGWGRMLRAVSAGGPTGLPPPALPSHAFAQAAAGFAARACVTSALLLVLLGVCLLAVRRAAAASWAVLGIAVIEIVSYAVSTRASFDVRATPPPAEAAFLASHPGDARLWQLAAGPNAGTQMRVGDIWGYDPLQPLRYAQFMAWTQGSDPARAVDGVAFRRVSPLFALLRLRYVFQSGPGGTVQVTEEKNALPRLLLVSDWRRAVGLPERLAALGRPSFDPRRTALLETAPRPAPAPGPPAGAVRLVASDSDSLTIEADTPRPQILLITDAYARGWRAVALPGDTQRHYDLLPADAVLRAVPLAAGHHRLRVEYAPAGFRWGLAVSLACLAVYLSALARPPLSRMLIRARRGGRPR